MRSFVIPMLTSAAVLTWAAYGAQAQRPDRKGREPQDQAKPTDSADRGPDRQAQDDQDRGPPRDRPGRDDRPGKRTATQAPSKSGVVADFHKNADGDVAGLRLDDGTEVRFPPSDKLSGVVALKDKVTLTGWTFAGEFEIHAATIENQATGKKVTVDRPPPELSRSAGGRRPERSDDEADERKPPRRPDDEADERKPPRRPDDAADDSKPARRAEDGDQRPRNKPERKEKPGPKQDGKQQYSLEQAVSDQAQLHTIAFDGLAFLTGDFGSDTFLPPGKVSDYFGFQYMRDIDAKEGGHNTSFLTRIADNTLAILTANQKAQLLALAREQEADIRRFAEMRLPLIKAFRRNLEGDLPAGSQGLDKNAVLKRSAALYELDGRLAYARAKVMGSIISGLNARQKAAFAKLKFGDSRTWPDVPEQLDKRSLPHAIDVAVMTYASEMFAWYAGSVEADVYFCPERHGMYFGGFGMKTAPAMGKQDYSISTSLTGDAGEAFLATLTEPQQKCLTDLVDRQRPALEEIVKTRRAIAVELRQFQKVPTADLEQVLALSRRYGELDGELSYLYATAFAQVGRALTAEQKAKLAKLRTSDPSDAKGPFLYSDPIKLPVIENTDALFGVRTGKESRRTTTR